MRRKRKFKYPKTISVGGKTFKLKVYKKIPKEVEEELGLVAGWCDWNESIIGLVLKYTLDDNLTLFHEIGHAAADAVNPRNPLANEKFGRPFFSIFYAALKDIDLIG